jgi:nicotinate-nucleotide pyrophosphorylase (carboxylating)
MDPEITDVIVRRALKEDKGSGDITTRILVPSSVKVEAVIVAREPAIISGLAIVSKTFILQDRRIQVSFCVTEGSCVKPGQVLLRLNGRAQGILTAERVALNFLGRMSGVATLTRAYVDAVRGTGVVILDTRKTTPGLRYLDRCAVRAGGGKNHRFDLGAMVLIKDNHRMLSGHYGSLAGMIRKARAETRKPLEVEVDTLAELADVLNERPDMILLDNMPPVLLRKAVEMVSSHSWSRRPVLEASGGISLKNVRKIALSGVDRISIGALTHSARCTDVSLEIQKVLDV